MTGKKMTVTFLRQNHIRPDWQANLNGEAFDVIFGALVTEMKRYGVELDHACNDDIAININSYADLLNSVRISSPADGIVSQCVGHIIGKSENLNLLEDIRRAVNRVAFAPETIPPEDHNRRVCHNCGCGC
jgi:hypothetical protein